MTFSVHFTQLRLWEDVFCLVITNMFIRGSGHLESSKMSFSWLVLRVTNVNNASRYHSDDLSQFPRFNFTGFDKNDRVASLIHGLNECN